MPVIIQPSPGGGSVVITDSSGAVWGNHPIRDIAEKR